MSSLRQGVLRAVRLLPDVVKIGMETGKTALPPAGEEEQILNKASPLETNTEEPSVVSEELRELTARLTAAQAGLEAAEAEKLRLQEKVTALEEDLAKTTEAASRREREMQADVEAVRARAENEGRTQGHAEGLEDGYKAGMEKARNEVGEQYKEKFAALVTMLEGISTKLEENFAELIALNQPRMLRLWQEMLEKMLQRETTLAPDGVLDTLSDVLSRLSDKNHVLIYVAPEDLQLLEERMHGEFEEILRGVRHLELKSDTNVDRGSCLVETNLGVYDARWRTQLEQIDSVIEKLFRKLGKTPGSGSRSRRKTAEPAEGISEPVKKTAVKKTAARKKVLGPNRSSAGATEATDA